MEMRSRVTLPVVLRLWAMPRGMTSMSPLLSVTDLAPSELGASHSPGPVLRGFWGVPPSSILCGAVDDLKDVVAVLVVLELFRALVGFDGEDGGERSGL